MIKEESAKLHKLCSDIAFFLNVGEQNPVWVFNVPADEDSQNYPSQTIKHATRQEPQITIRIETYGASKGRIEVSGNWHIGKNRSFVDVREYIPGSGGNYTALPSITCSPTKTPEQIAKDIKRRFLPEYLPMLEKAIAKRNAHDNYRAKTRANLLELARIVCFDAEERLSRAEGRADETSELSCYSSDHAYATIRANDEGCSQLKIDSLTMDQARRILAIVAEPRG